MRELLDFFVAVDDRLLQVSKSITTEDRKGKEAQTPSIGQEQKKLTRVQCGDPNTDPYPHPRHLHVTTHGSPRFSPEWPISPVLVNTS